ncbi:MAG: hypothetical protein GY856_26000 [bacterium]|nr:hypothetical protein [bacterium]
MGAKIGKTRNSTFTLMGGLAVGLVAEYLGWVSWIFAASKQSALALHPETLWLVIQDVAESGAWSIFSWTPTGFALYLIWFIELLMIVGVSAMVAISLISRPFCERCRKWAVDLDDSPNLEPVQEPEDLKTRLEQADYSSLEAMGGAEPGAGLFTKVSFSSCPVCKRECYLTMKTVKVTVDSKGKESKSEENLLENLILSPEIHQQLLGSWRSAS